MNPQASTVASASVPTEGLVSIRVGAQTFGVPVLKVQDVISQTTINRVPLAPPEVAGSLNLRGRIVTAVDMRVRLRMAPRAPAEGFMCVIVEQEGELYALLVDDVGDVLWLTPQERAAAPATMSPRWQSICTGLYLLQAELLIVIDIEQVLNLGAIALAA